MKSAARSTQSRQIGREISRLIGIAQRVKEMERKKVEPVQEEHSLQEWRRIAKEKAAALAEKERQLKEARVQRLSNFSIEDIERELVRRVNGHK